MKKRLVCTLILVAMVALVSLMLLPTQAAAKSAEIEMTATHSHPICGSSCGCASDAHSSTTWTAWDGTTKLYTGDYYLTRDIVLDRTMILDYSYTTRLCLNGHSITCEDMVFDIYSYRMLLITDCVGTGKVETTNSSCTISNNKYLSIWGGTITNSSGNAFGTINAWSGTTTYVCGGRVEAEDGVAIYSAPGSKIYIEGGTVHGGGYSAAIDSNGGSGGISTLKITGGSITADHTSAVNFAYNFHMTGGYIDGDVFVWSEEGMTTISGGTINGMLDTSSSQTTITGGDMSVWLSGPEATIAAGTFRGSCYFAGTNATVSGGNFSACDKVIIRGNTWICGGYFSLIQTESANLYLSGVPSIKSLQMRESAVVSAQNKDGTGSFGGDPIEVRLDHPYTTTAWEDGDIIVKNVKSDAVAEKFTLAGEDAEWMYLERSGTNLVLRLVPHGTCGDDATWFFDPRTNTLTISGSGAMEDYTSNGTPWVDHKNTVRTIVIEEGITGIGSCAFKYFEKLDQLILPDSLQSIGYESFLYCPSLKELAIPSNVRKIGSYAFEQCISLETVVFPDGLTAIDGFNACTGLKTVAIPASVTRIEFSAFPGCSALTDVYYGGTKAQWEQIDIKDPNNYNKYLTNATVHYIRCEDGHSWTEATCTAPKTCTVCGVTEGEPGAHTRDSAHKCMVCGQIGGECGENVVWGLGENGVLTISGIGDMYDFEYGTRSPWADYRPEIISVVIGDGVTSIGSCAFDYCFKMTSVTIGNSITIIGDYAFSSCEALTSINIPSSVTIIGDRAFEFCNALTSVTIPEGVTSVGIRAFENCIKLTGVEIPDSVTSIGAYAFYMCTSLKQVTFGANSQLLTIGKEAFKFTNINSIIIPKRVTHIGNSAFHYSGLNSLTFEENSQLSYIGDHAFDSCGMTNARIPDRVTSIGAGAFENCTHLVSITMGSGVTSIGDAAFANCHKLWHVLFTGSENQWYGISIGTDNTCLTNAVRHYNCAGGEITDLENLVCAACVANGYVPSGICGDHLTWRLESNGVLTISGTGDMYDYAYAPWYPYTRIIRKVVIESGATSIGNCAFASCNNLSEVTLPDGVTRIGNSAFIGCSGLAEIVLPDSITVIGERAFMNCGRLSEIVIPEGVTSIEYATFYNCDGLTSITLSDNLTSIGILAFGSCDSFVSITIPDGVEIIGESAFNSCENLVSITIPASVTTIGANNFMSSLWHVLYKGAEEQWGQIQNSDKWITSATVHYSCTGDEIVDFANRICTICCNHKWSDATCTDPQICSICGFAGSEALGHDLTQHAAKAPTCTDIGWEAYETCSRCDYTTYKELPANGHNYTAVVTEPTCTDGGYTTYTCHCGDSYVADLVDPLGHDLTQHTAKAPTCTDIGWEAYETCSRCDYSTYAELPATGAHTWGDWVVEKAATCTENGSRTRSCVYCVASWTEIIRALGHDLTQQVAKAPTCTDIGWEAYETCSRCDYTTYKELPANGHDYTAVVTDPTCTDGGYTTYTCHCGDSYVADLVDPLGHDLTQHAAKAPTCTDIGWEAYETCSRCDYTTYKELPANGHAYTAVVTDPTCTDGGYTTYTCHCGDSYVADLVDPLGHSEAVLDAVAPGCTTEGLTEGSYCIVCGEVLTVQNKVPATGHKDENRDFLCDVCGADLCTDHVEMLLPSVPATCEGTGLTEGKKCANCGEILVAQETIPALGHSYEGVVVEPTCTELGYTVYTCEVCGDSYVDDFVETLAHAYVAVATKPTCTEAGYTTYTCADCGDRFIGSYVSAKGHSYDEGVVTTEPTCVRDGLLTYTCTDCGSTKTEAIEKTGIHSYEAVVTEPTCTEVGYTAYTCAECGDSYVGDFVNATGHSFDQWVTDQEPTCAEAGIKHRSCTACGETEVERIAKLPHNFEDGTCADCGAPEAALGDANGDGKIDTTDAKLIMQYDLGLIGEDGINLAAMDVNGDGKVDTTDAKLIMQLDLGLISEFPKP